MKRFFKKSGPVYRFVSCQRFLTALILCGVFSFVYIAANSFIIVGGNDDYCAFHAVLGGNTAIPCVGYFYTAFCSFVQPLFGVINIYMVLQALICFFSLTSIDYFFLSKLGTKKGLFYSAIFDVIFFSFLVIEVYFNYTAVLSSTAGLLCLFYGSACEKRRKVKIVQLIAGFVFMLIGSQMRFSPFAACCVIGAVYAVSFFVSCIAKNAKNGGVKKSFTSALKRYGVTGILLVAAIVSAVGVNTVSEIIKNSSEDYRELSEYNAMLGAVNDTKYYKEYSDPEAFEEVGLRSEMDIFALKAWFVDDTFFTADRLKDLAGVLYEQNDDGLLNKSIIEQTLYPYKVELKELIESKFILLYLLILIVSIFGTVIFSVLFPKQKWLLIKLVLLAFLWSFFFLISNAFEAFSVLLVPLMAVSLVITLRYDRYQAVITLSIIAALLVMLSYLVSVRLLFYTLFAPAFPAFVLMIFGLSEDRAVKIIKKPKFDTVLKSGLAVTLAAVSVFLGVYEFTLARVQDQESNPAMEEYIENHPETIFLVNQTMLTKNYYNPFILSEEKDNIVNYGLWLTKAKCFKDQQKRNGIDNLFKDAIDSNMQIIVWEDDLSNSVEEWKKPIYYLRQYYNYHYAESDEIIEIRRTGRVANYSLYSIISEPYSE